MQYGNPYFAQPFQQIQPYQDRLAQLQNNYQQAMPYGQMQMQQTKKQVQATENSKAKNKADALIAQAMDPEHVQQQETEEFQREPRPVDLFNPAEEYSKGE